MCIYFCDKWFAWSEGIVPRNKNVSLNEFVRLTGDYGPIKNYYKKIYDVDTIMINQVIPKTDTYTVCLTIDNMKG